MSFQPERVGGFSPKDGATIATEKLNSNRNDFLIIMIISFQNNMTKKSYTFVGEIQICK